MESVMSDKGWCLEKPLPLGLSYLLASVLSHYATGVLHPLDVVKVRLQSNDGRPLAFNLVPEYPRFLPSVLLTIYRQEGWMGLWRGFHYSVGLQAVVGGAFFWLYEWRKNDLTSTTNSMLQNVTRASLEAGIVLSLLTQPLWTVKTRLLLQMGDNHYEPSAQSAASISPTEKPSLPMVRVAREIIQQHGILGFWRGTSLGLLLSTTGMVQMLTYEGARQVWNRSGRTDTLQSVRDILCGFLSKLVSSVVSHPLTTIRTRIQQNQFLPKVSFQTMESRNDGRPQPKYNSSLHAAAQTWKIEGLRGFYKGWLVGMLKGMPTKGLYFWAYERVKPLLGIHNYQCN